MSSVAAPAPTPSSVTWATPTNDPRSAPSISRPPIPTSSASTRSSTLGIRAPGRLQLLSQQQSARRPRPHPELRPVAPGAHAHQCRRELQPHLRQGHQQHQGGRRYAQTFLRENDNLGIVNAMLNAPCVDANGNPVPGFTRSNRSAPPRRCRQRSLTSVAP